MELQVCAILSHKHRCFVPFAPPPLLTSEPTFSVLKNLKVLKTYMFDFKKRRINTQGDTNLVASEWKSNHYLKFLH